MATSPRRQTGTGRAARRAPVLETARLWLRPFTPADLDALCRITADAEVMRYISDGRPIARAETATNLRNIIESFRRRGFGRWAVDEKASGALLGYCGLARAPEAPGIELVYMLGRDVWGRGFATEASTAVISFAFEEIGLERIYAFTMPDNRRSRRTLERLGMEYLGDDSYYGYACVCYALARARWQESRIADWGWRMADS